MLSRVADALYWMSRYLERAEHTARLIDIDLQLTLDHSSESGALRWLRLFEALEVPTPVTSNVDSSTLAHNLVLERNNPSSIVSAVSAARENLRQVREQCSSEMWEQLNRLYLQVVGMPVSKSWLQQSQLFFHSVQDGAHLFHGVTDSTMSHGEGWYYIQLGRYVERTHSLGTLIGARFARVSGAIEQASDNSDPTLEWVGLLKYCAAFEAYCKKYTAEVTAVRVAEFLLLNADFPHSIRFSVDQVHAALRAVGELAERKADAPLRLAGRLRASLSFTAIEEIMAEGLQKYLSDIRALCAQAHNAIHQIYFDYSVESALVE
ncbi:MAG: alpha-E domain-containing protein [Acidobacteria bacterium]|nr:alpha-E domain-containing protein [Acidobacteriota bacterium]